MRKAWIAVRLIEYGLWAILLGVSILSIYAGMRSTSSLYDRQMLMASFSFIFRGLSILFSIFLIVTILKLHHLERKFEVRMSSLHGRGAVTDIRGQSSLQGKESKEKKEVIRIFLPPAILLVIILHIAAWAISASSWLQHTQFKLATALSIFAFAGTPISVAMVALALLRIFYRTPNHIKEDLVQKFP